MSLYKIREEIIIRIRDLIDFEGFLIFKWVFNKEFK